MKKWFIHWRINYCASLREICTSSMLTVTVLLLYRKLIPLWCPPWCDNLITLGCHWILFFLRFSKVKKDTRGVCAFWVPSRQALDQIGRNSGRMLSERLLTKPCLRILIIPLINNLCLFCGQLCIFPFSNFSLFLKNNGQMGCTDTLMVYTFFIADENL